MDAREFNILYVEDDDDAREIITVLFRATQPNFIVKTVASEVDALAAISCQKFDVYILDNWLGETSGSLLCQKIRATDETTPIVIYSAVAYEKEIEEGLKAGANAYLTKPNDMNKLVPTLQKLLAIRSTIN